MNGYKLPEFKKGNLLTQEMLEALKQYEVGVAEYSYVDYGDGVLCGCRVHGEKGVIYIEKGLVVHKGNVVAFAGDRVRASTSNRWQAVKLVIGDMEHNQNFSERKLEIRITETLERENNSIELCRVKLQQGAVIRSVYQNFEDLSTEYDTVNLIYAQWASYCSEGINPLILEEFANEAMKGKAVDEQDMAFIYDILSQKGRAMPKKQLLYYIAHRLGRQYSDLDNAEIYGQLRLILKQMRTGAVHQKQTAPPRRLLVE